MTTASSTNSYIKDGILYLAPTLTEEEIGHDNVFGIIVAILCLMCALTCFYLGLNGPYIYNITGCTFNQTSGNGGFIPNGNGGTVGFNSFLRVVLLIMIA